MKINYLIKNIDNEDFDLVAKLKVNPYIPVMDKQKIAMDIIATCTDEIDGIVEIDYLKMDIYFKMRMLKEHTNLDISEDFDEMVDQYDALYKSCVMNRVVALFENDYDFMYDMLMQELENLEKENSLERHLVRIVHKLNGMLDGFSDKIGDVDFNKLLPEGMDASAFLDLMNNLK